HAIVRGPGCLGGIKIETCTGAKIPVIILARNACPAGAGIRGTQHQAVPGSHALCTGLDHEGFFSAGQPGKKEQYGYLSFLGLGGDENRKRHGQAYFCGVMPVKSLTAVETTVLAYTL